MPDLASRRSPQALRTQWLKPLPPALRLVLHGEDGARRAAALAWGVGFSGQACRAVTRDSRATLWLGPDEYLLYGGAEADLKSQAATVGALETALNDTPHALVDISHRQFALEVSGPHAATILSGACPLDLDPSEFPIGMCTRTVLSKADIVLWRIREDAFHLEVWRSFAGYVMGMMREIAVEFYPG
ncbi:MAG: sarcosine oxidase subunit gamma family protein [Gammaproteobacteria bacterium]